MRYDHFGVLLEELRLKHNMTRDKLSQNICTPKQLYRIEKGESEPSIYLLHRFSIVFNMDLNEYYKMYFVKKTLTALEGANAINNAIENDNVPLIKKLAEQYEELDDFKEGEPFQIICYAKALCSALIDQNYKTSLSHCIKGIKIVYPDFELNNLTNNMYSNVSFVILVCMSQNYFELNQYLLGMKVLTGVIEVIETHLLNSSFSNYNSKEYHKKIYQIVLCNMGIHLYKHSELKEALIFADKGINFAIKEETFRHLPSLLALKYKILCKLGQMKDSRELYEQAIDLYQITGRVQSLSEFRDEIQREYPDILGDS